MSTPKRSSSPRLSAVQPKRTSTKQVAAPPVYKPQSVPKVLQAKLKQSVQPAVATAGRKVVAPATYRPQPTPKVLQTKKSLAIAHKQPFGTTAAVSASPASARTAPLKLVGGRPRAVAAKGTSQPCAHTGSCSHQPSRPLQMKSAGVRQMRPSTAKSAVATRPSQRQIFVGPATSLAQPAMRRTQRDSPFGSGPRVPGSRAIQRRVASMYRVNPGPPGSQPGFALTSRGALTFTHNQHTVQLKQDVIQGDFWDVVGYVYDAISASSIIATIIGTIATAASAGGLGWLAPFFIPLVGSAVQEILKIEDEEHGQNKLALTGRKQKYLEVVSHMVNGLTGIIGILVGSGAVTAGAAVAGVALFIMIVLEGLRVNIIDRETIYGLVKRKIRGAEREQLLPV